MKIKTDVKPKKNLYKILTIEAGFLALGRGLQSTSNFEHSVKENMKLWADNYSFKMKVLPAGPVLAMRKENGKLVYKGNKDQKTDLTIEIKNVETAFQMITTQAGVAQVYANHGIGVIGDISKTMPLIRSINTVMAYLFPEILSKRILKKVPKMTLGKYINRLRIYTLGMAFGK